MAGTVDSVNTRILRECREQIGLTIDEVGSKVGSIAKLEAGEKPPTFKQLDTLADLYNVPRWVFISDELPSEYHFTNAIPAFRQFSQGNTDTFEQHEVRRLVATVEGLRELVIELREETEESLPAFSPPELEDNLSLQEAAEKIREWLGVRPDTNLQFSQWRELLEQKNVFIFLTNKYKGWSHVDKNLFRGLTIYHSVLPVIIINDSDAKKAQSFTLFHELGHLIRNENAIDDWSDRYAKVEEWCDKLAAGVLMPNDRFQQKAAGIGNINDLKSVQKLAVSFQVSSYACLVKLKQMKSIDQTTYNALEKKLQEEYEKNQQQLKTNRGGPSRNRARETLNQYGRIYTNTLFQAHDSGELTLHKLCKAFDLKQASHVLELRDKL